MASRKIVTGQMMSCTAHIDVQKVEVCNTDISLMFKLSGHEVQNLALSFKVAYLGAIVLFTDEAIREDIKKLLKHIVDSSTKCSKVVEITRNAMPELKFQTKDEPEAKSCCDALVNEFKGFSEEAEKIFKKLDEKFKSFCYRRDIKVEIKEIIAETGQDPDIYLQRNHDLWKIKEIHLRNTTLAAICYFKIGVDHAVKILTEFMTAESRPSSDSITDLTFTTMHQQLVATRCAFLWESIRTAFCDLDFFQRELVASSKEVKRHKLHYLVELFMKSTEDLDEDRDDDDEKEDEGKLPPFVVPRPLDKTKTHRMQLILVCAITLNVIITFMLIYQVLINQVLILDYSKPCCV